MLLAMKGLGEAPPELTHLNLKRLFWKQFGLKYPTEVRETLTEREIADTIDMFEVEATIRNAQSGTGGQSPEKSQQVDAAYKMLPRVTREDQNKGT